MSDINTLDNWPIESSAAISRFENFYMRKNVLVTGGASFIGSHLVDALIALGANVRIVDDLSSGKKENLQLGHKGLEFIHDDILKANRFYQHCNDMDVVFHLAAVHGGRGFIEARQLEILRNLAIDNTVFDAAVRNKVPIIIYASSACAYPHSLQNDCVVSPLLSEENSGSFEHGGISPDGVYGWSKLIGEFQLKSYATHSKSRGCAARIFTAYGERENESHAVIALIAKALLRLDPFPIWGDGRQTRNFTYVSDTVAGLLLAPLNDQTANFTMLNVGTSSPTSILELVSLIFDIIEWRPREFLFESHRPVGVQQRASNNDQIKAAFQWEPSVKLFEGLARTIDWYARKEDRPSTQRDLELLLEMR